MKASRLIEAVSDWASSEEFVAALALVGSHARGTQRPDSDIDLVMLTTEPSALLGDHAWIAQFGAKESIETEDWGRLKSLRVRYVGGPEVEFGITELGWAETQPLDPGTAEVVAGGMRVLFDPSGLLGALQRACADRSTLYWLHPKQDESKCP